MFLVGYGEKLRIKALDSEGSQVCITLEQDPLVAEGDVFSVSDFGLVRVDRVQKTDQNVLLHCFRI